MLRVLCNRLCLLMVAGICLPAFGNIPPATNVVESSLSAKDFLLKDYREVAIATDLEPDDVLALAILFKEANALYQQSSIGKYPIDLIIVGEGNTKIKRMRMKKLLKEYLHVPPGVVVQVIEGKSTLNNIFPYDGYEFFEPEVLNEISFPKPTCNLAVAALENWAEQAQNPLIIQLKPAPELLYLTPDVSKKTTVLFYGSFNIRETIDDEVLNYSQFGFKAHSTLSARLDSLMSFLSNRFSKIGIVETYGTLGNHPSVCSETEWSQEITQIIANSNDPLIKKFRTLCANWNLYILDKSLSDCEKISSQLAQEGISFAEDLHSEIVELQTDRSRFDEVYKNIKEHSVTGDSARSWNALLRKMRLAKELKADIQFTLSDVLVALATTDCSDLFQATPIRASYDENGFLIPVPEPQSNVVYYDQVDQKKIADSIKHFLED